MQDPSSEPVTFALTKNLHVLVKIVNLHCCVFRECWCFLTSGMQTAAQDEVLVLLERLPDEDEIPRDVFYHFLDLYERSTKGHFIMPLGHSLITVGNPPSK
jgi:MAD (mothers against decapentaplegic) interacting protein